MLPTSKFGCFCFDAVITLHFVPGNIQKLSQHFTVKPLKCPYIHLALTRYMLDYKFYNGSHFFLYEKLIILLAYYICFDNQYVIHFTHVGKIWPSTVRPTNVLPWHSISWPNYSTTIDLSQPSKSLLSATCQKGIIFPNSDSSGAQFSNDVLLHV